MTTESNLPKGAPKGMELSDAEVTKARSEGAKEAVKETAKDAYIAATDGEQAGDVTGEKYPGSEDIQLWAHWVEMPVAEFEKAVADKDRIADEKVAGLLKLERAGQNRTPYVKALCKRLKVKSPYEVTSAGPDYTNDVTNVSKL